MNTFINIDAAGETQESIVSLINKAIELSTAAIYADFYFNPLFGKELPDIVPLEKYGFTVTVFEIEREDGTHVSASISYEDNTKLDLGEILLTGEDVRVVKGKPLQPIMNVINFVRSKARQHQGG
jgi:hypothetical protein